MAHYDPENPCIVQSDRTVLVDVHSRRYPEARDALARFAELVKSPEHVHTYRITPLSIWNACAAGLPPQQMVETLHTFAKYDVPPLVARDIVEVASRYGKCRLRRQAHGLALVVDTQILAEELVRHREVAPFLTARLSPCEFVIDGAQRGRLKQALIKVGYPIEDLAGYRQGEALSLGRILRPKPGANQAYFYTIVSQDTVEQDFVLKRQLFLCEQGYEYAIHDAK